MASDREHLLQTDVEAAVTRATEMALNIERRARSMRGASEHDRRASAYWIKACGIPSLAGELEKLSHGVY